MAWGVFYRPEEMGWQPRFTVPLSTALLSDPAFSSDPRTHPHFNVAFDTPPVPAHPPRPKQIHRPTQTNRKASMKTLIRRLTSHHNLDRIDELDETDPFGTSYHHDGPYEAISSTQTPHANVHHLKRASDRSSHPTHHQSPPRVPSIRSEKGLSLHLKPGQILPPNIVYSPHISGVAPVSNHSSRQSNTPAIVAHPDQSPSHSLPNSRTHSVQDSPLHPMNDLHNRPSSSLRRMPSQRHSRRNTPDIHILPLHHDRSDMPHVPTQTTVTVFPPPRHESRLHNLGPSPLLPPSVSRKTRITEGTVLPHDAGQKSVHSLDSSHTINTTTTRSSNTQYRPLRMRHFPKRLVMPAPLQPQPPQPQFRFPPVEHANRRNEYPEDRTSEPTNPGGQPTVYNRGPNLLRKKSSAFPAELPIPYHVPILQNDAVPEIADIPTKTENEVERTKEKIRRRRLSKRKNDIQVLALA